MLLQAGEVNASVGFDETTKGWARKRVERRAKGEEQRAKGYTLIALALCPLRFALRPWPFALRPWLFQPATPLIGSQQVGDETGGPLGSTHMPSARVAADSRSKLLRVDTLSLRFRVAVCKSS
jgi:hypothetical protein